MACPHGNAYGACRQCRLDSLERLFGDGSDNYDEEWPGLSPSVRKSLEGRDE